MKKMRVALIGQGRSGRNIHGKFFLSEANTFCEVVCVVEKDALRREKAAKEFGCDTCCCHTELFGRKDIDLVVNASYSQDHYAITKALLNHGFHVLTEKPFGRTYFECMDLCKTAQKNGVIVTAFHQTLYAPIFLKIKEIIRSGKLGDVFQISLKYSGFARRWDWQTLQACCAGSVYNSGPHPIGQALDLLGWADVSVAFSSLKQILTSGDSDDYGKIILYAPDKKTVVDIEINCADAYANDFVFKIYGSKGTLRADNSQYEMRYIADFSAYPVREVIRESLSDEKGNPAFCQESLEFTEQRGEAEGSSFDAAVCTFYQMLYRAIITGAALEVTPEMAAKVIAVAESCHAQNPLPVKFEA